MIEGVAVWESGILLWLRFGIRDCARDVVVQSLRSACSQYGKKSLINTTPIVRCHLSCICKTTLSHVLPDIN
jgi:hypothetical protein